MAYTFDGTNKIITYSIGTTAIDVKDIYSRWKNWVQDEGSMYLKAIDIVGGDPVDEINGIYISTYVFLINGWRIRPAEENHKVKVHSGILLTDIGESPFISTVGSYNVLVEYSQPVTSQTVMLETGISGLTQEESEQLFKALTTAKFLALK